MSAADWELIAASRNQNKPTRDMVVTDGQKLTLGDTTLTFTLTPGHTPGTVSTLIPVKDNGTPHLVAEWGGTGFNFPRARRRSGPTPRPPRSSATSPAKAGADALISNHTNLDGSKTKMPALALRKPGDPHPYVIGTEAVKGLHDRGRRVRESRAGRHEVVEIGEPRARRRAPGASRHLIRGASLPGPRESG